MTKIYISGIIDKLYISVSKEKEKNISMEENADKFNNREPHCKQSVACSNEQKLMGNLNINLTQATNYLIQLFYKTDQKYSCTRTKVGKLISIVSFVYACNDKIAFNESIYKYDDCGTAIKEIMNRFDDRDVYTQCQYISDGKQITESFNHAVIIPDNYSNIADLTEETKQTIENVFRVFGAYSPSALGECINPIVNHHDMTNTNGEVQLQKFINIKRHDFDKNKIVDATLIDFLFS